jgi:hypothetical protein
MTEDIPRYVDDCLTDKDNALISSVMPGTPRTLLSPSMPSSGIIWSNSRLPASGLISGGFSSRFGVTGDKGSVNGLFLVIMSMSFSRGSSSNKSGCTVGKSFCRIPLYISRVAEIFSTDLEKSEYFEQIERVIMGRASSQGGKEEAIK